jgi:hypothetical protein
MPNADPSLEAPGIVSSPAEPLPLPPAWQPITPRGVAAFAFARIGRVLAVQFIVAGVVAGAVCWFLSTAWLPTARRAIRQLPETGGITNSILASPRLSTQPLAQSRFIAFVVDVQDKTGAEVQTDVLITFRRRDIRVCSLLGCASKPYEPEWRVPLSRVEVQAAWGAWRSTLFIAVTVAVIAILFVNWFVLALLVCPLVWVFAFFKDRQITLPGSWKLALAALLPGALVATALIVLYGLEIIDLVRFLLGWCLHLFVGLAYLVAAPLRLPKVQEAVAAAKNPFVLSPGENSTTPK